MDQKLSIVGGTYFEACSDPNKETLLFGSALRAAAALSGKGFDIELTSCLAEDDLPLAESICSTFEITPKFHDIEETVVFYYYHPLSSPELIGNIISNGQVKLPKHSSKYILYYGMIEADVAVEAEYLVYDPQNHVPFTVTGSIAKHLALVLNKNEAYLISGADDGTSIQEVGKSLLSSQNAEVVIIKNGSKGAVVIDNSGYQQIPVYETSRVWPIGSGDIFSAVFAWKWAIEGLLPFDAAQFASKYTATFCENEQLPLPTEPLNLPAVEVKGKPKKIYLAGPFFTMGQRWLVNEFRNLLTDFGNEVFSPYHDVGIPTSKNNQTAAAIAEEDLSALKDADLILGIVCDHDPGTLFEIGFARAIGKQVLIFSENVTDEDLLMLVGTDCKIVKDFSTAVYMASW